MKLTSSQPKKVIRRAVDKYIQYMAPTYGPAGKSVLVKDGNNIRLLDDGHLASQKFEILDELENAVISYIKEVTNKTNSRVGDGTTTSAIIMGAVVDKVFGEEEEFSLTQKTNFHAEAVELKKALVEATKALQKASKKIDSQEELYSIAHNSFNDKQIAKIIAETIFKVGRDGVVAIEDSNTMETYAEVVNGLEIDKGIASPYLVGEKGDITLKNPSILLANKRVESFKELAEAIDPMLKTGTRELVVVAEGFGDDALAGCIVHSLKGTFRIGLVNTPGFGDNRLDNLKDIGVVVGGTVLDPKTNEPVTYGSAQSVVITKDKTTFLGGGGTKKEVDAYIKLLKSQKEEASQYDKDRYDTRVAKILGGVAVIKVGAYTESEQITVKAKVEDAVNATKAAFRGGIVKGGGVAFEEIKTSSELFNEILKAPRKQLEANGKEFLDDNVYDPAEVLIAALESGISIGCGLIEMGGITTDKIKEDDK